MSEEVFPPGQPTVDSAGPWLPALDTKTITIIILALSLGGPISRIIIIIVVFFLLTFLYFSLIISWCYMIWKCTQTM